MFVADLFASDATTLPFVLPNAPGYAAKQDAGGGFDIALPDGSVYYAEHFFNQAWSDRAAEFLQENATRDWRTTDWRAVTPEELERVRFTNIRWRQDSIKFCGNIIPLPRLTAWYGDPGAAYTYSGIKSEPNPWNDGLLRMKQRIEERVGVSFNSVLLNWYRDGRDKLGWHADNEKELGVDPVIASANFGATRNFKLRRNDDHSQTITFPLSHGSLLVMRGALQRHWQHEVPRQTRVVGSRFNLTFRTIHG